MVRGCTGTENSQSGQLRRIAAALLVLGVAGCGGSEDDAAPVSGSGCGQSSNLTPWQWVERTINVGGTTRVYDVRAPDGYDAFRPYRVVYQFHGCSNAREDDNPPLESVAGSDAILVRPRAVDICWQEGANSP